MNHKHYYMESGICLVTTPSHLSVRVTYLTYDVLFYIRIMCTYM